MLMLLPLVLAFAGEPSPAPAATQRPTPLTEIGRVRALPACVPIVAHANGAITQALDNDRTLAIITTNLHNTDFDKLNWLQRRNAIEALMRQAESMRNATSAGDAEVKKLREYAVNSPDPQRKAELKTFADALGGALYRQKKAAVEFMRDVAILRGRDEGAEAKSIMAANNPQAPDPRTTSVRDRAMVNTLPEPPPINKQMALLADTMDGLTQGILADEGIAADHSIAATSGC
jgi:hypothetical protein